MSHVPPCPGRGIRHRRFAFWRTSSAILALAALLGGCASIAPEEDAASLRTLLAERSLAADALAEPPAAAPAEAAADAPLEADAAVRLALRHSARAQEALAALALSDADRAQASSLPNPVFAFERLVEGRGLEIDRALRFDVLGVFALPWRARWAGQQHEAARLTAAQALLEIAADTRRAWIGAVAAQQRLAAERDAEEASDIAYELARRMARAGHWNALELQRETMLRADARTRRETAELAALAARERLARLLGPDADQAGFKLPAQLPPLPPQPAPAEDLEARALRDRLDLRAAQTRSAYLADTLGLARTQALASGLELGAVRNSTWSGPGDRSESQHGFSLDLALPVFDWGGARQARAQALYAQSLARMRGLEQLAASEAREGAASARIAYDVARRHRDELLPTRQAADEQMLLRYNGMLASVWELLAARRATALATVAAIDAQRDFWLADVDLQLALSGSSPRGRIALQGASEDMPTTAEAH